MSNEPKDRPTDLDPAERELLRAWEGAESIAARHAGCPSPDLLLASQAGVPPDEAARRAAAHLEKCDFCRVLVRDLASEDLVMAKPDELARMRERVMGEVGQLSKAKANAAGVLGFRSRWALPVSALAAVALFGIYWIRFHQKSFPAAPPSAAVGRPAKPTAPSVFQWEKLPPKLEANSILVWRGEPKNAQEEYSADLMRALAYYRDDNFAEAAQQLAKVAKNFPRGVEAQLYLGVSQVYLERNAEAVVPLTAAQRLGPDVFRADATWYLALAYQRSGESTLAVAELRRLCDGKSNYASRACAGILELVPTEGGSSRR